MNVLAEKIGPLPVGGWVVVVGGGLLVSTTLRRKQTAAAAAAAPPDPYGATTPTIGNLGGVFSSSSDPSVGQGPTATYQAPTTNEDWRRLAFDELTAHGYSPNLVDSALTDYLQGLPMSAAEVAVKELALMLAGPPPLAPPPAVAAPPTTIQDPPPSQPTAPNTAPSSTPAPAAVPFSPPPDQYIVGQVVNPAAGESVVKSVWSSVYGWLNLTSKGGVYASGGSQPVPGSYLGYASTTPNPSGEIAAHGDFSHGDIQVQPGGGYVLVNNNGERYQFG